MFRGFMVKIRCDEDVTDEIIEKCYFIIAKIVRDQGNVYLPIFQRIHEEREKRKSGQDLRSIALQAANLSPNG